jgi:hypothetical protein
MVDGVVTPQKGIAIFILVVVTFFIITTCPYVLRNNKNARLQYEAFYLAFED